LTRYCIGEAALASEGLIGPRQVEHGAGNLDATRDWFARSLEEFRALGIEWGIGSALSGLGWVALASGDGDEQNASPPSLRRRFDPAARGFWRWGCISVSSWR